MVVCHIRTEPKLRVFKIRVVGKIFWSQRGEVTGDLKKLHNKEPNDSYSSPKIIRVND
jgi:hypothetical protein